jgi:5-methyltetrahydropteroyltriglutamate--homocysteine methyltransferase
VIEARADTVGSLLRPPPLQAARERYATDEIDAAQFKEIEDAAVDEVVSLQEEAGLKVVTDGEMRRVSFQGQLAESVSGLGEPSIEAYLWGDWSGAEEVGDRLIPRPESLGVTGKLRRKRHLSVEEFVYLRARTTREPKITLPSPSLFANFWSEGSTEVYPTLDDFLDDVAEILREEVDELVRLGARYIQLDAPQYPLLLEEKTRRFYEQRGWDLDRWLSRGIELDNRVIGARAEDSDVTFGFHLCRGNQGSRWLSSGSYEAIARQIFGTVKADRLLLEYDDERSGGFEPLRYVPEDKTVVLGLVTTKAARRETPDELESRIHEAARYVPLERLAVSPQCGFSTSVVGNEISLEDEKHKLHTLVETAEKVWG